MTAVRARSLALDLVPVLAFAALTAIASQLSVHAWPVPFTLQTTAVLASGLMLGARRGALSQATYLAMGAAGMPVFAELKFGPQWLFGPTGGYLMAYPFAAFLVGYLAERGMDRRYLTSVIAMIVGLIVVYACGALWLGLFARTAAGNASVGLQSALMSGVAPFVAADIAKLLMAAAIVPGLWRIVGRAGR